MHMIMNPITLNGNKLRPARTISVVINVDDIVTALIISDVKLLKLIIL